MKLRSINRQTLIDGGLTRMLSLVYLGCIVVSRALIAPLTCSSELAIALFNPLRRRSQKLIDKRFERRTEHTQACWRPSARPRDETALDALTVEMLAW